MTGRSLHGEAAIRIKRVTSGRLMQKHWKNDGNVEKNGKHEWVEGNKRMPGGGLARKKGDEEQ